MLVFEIRLMYPCTSLKGEIYINIGNDEYCLSFHIYPGTKRKGEMDR